MEIKEPTPAISCATFGGHPIPPIDNREPVMAHSRPNSGPSTVPSVLVKILTFEYQLPQPYYTGHPCTAAEADALNALLKKGLSKGLYKVLAQGIARSGYSDPKALMGTAREDVREQGAEYINDFSLGFATGHDFQRALKVEAERIARTTLEAQLYRQGKSLKDISDGEREATLRALAETQSVRDEALRRVQVTQEIAGRAHIELLGEQSE